MTLTLSERSASAPKKITGRRARLIQKLNQKGMRYADKAERTTLSTSARFYAIADRAFDAKRQLSSV